MKEDIISVREIQKSDIPLLVNYWLGSDKAHFFERMGVDVNKIPTEEELTNNLLKQIATPIEQKNAYCIIWLLNAKPIGHCNTNPIEFGNEAFMHLHIWDQAIRTKGMGSHLLQLTLPYFFGNLKLKNLYCQPYALNPAPNKTLQKLGFEFVKEYFTTPGSLNFEQTVKLWHLSSERFNELYKKLPE